MKILYWDCKFHDYDESWDGETEERFYRCSHPNGCGDCEVNNAYFEADCKLLDEVKS